MILTKRDMELFAKLQSYGILTTRLVGSQVFPGVRLTTVLRRLRKLEAASYIHRLTGLGGYEVAWAVTKKGVLHVGDLPFKRHFRRDVLDHDIKLTELRLALEGIGVSHLWTPEHEIRATIARRHGLRQMQDRVVPDGLMSVRVNGIAESVAIEVELNFKNQRRYFHTFREYQSKSNIWAVWYLVSTPGLGESLIKLWEKANPYGSKVKFLCSIVDDVIRSPRSVQVYGMGHGKRITELWQPKAAQAPALALNRGESIAKKEEALITAENQEKILAPAC